MFLYGQWARLPLTTRALLAAQFNFLKVGSTHVQDNVVIADGYKIDDVERCLNVDAIQKYTGNNSTDMAVLWDALIRKIEGRDVPPQEVAAIVTETITINEVIVEPKKRGRPKK